MKTILMEFPSFEERWKEHLNYWGEEEAGLCNDMAEFSYHVVDLIVSGDTENLAVIFKLIERLMSDGDEDVKDCVATCFLENLMNRVSDDVFPAANFVHLLGPESRAYCKAWDEFTGVRTKGLW